MAKNCIEVIQSVSNLLDSVSHEQPPSAAKKKQYRITHTLGCGSYGTVKEAVHLPTNKHYAIKIIEKKNINDISEIRLQRELTITKELKHPNIVSLFDWFETRTKVYMVFELASGGELFDRIVKQGKFTEKDAANIVFTIFDALSFLHDNGVVHRDLKPENLLYRDTSEYAPLMIADFGVSNILENDDDVLNTFCGSPGYAAPEIVLKDGHSKPSDIWSVGVITYVLLCGYHPFKGPDVGATLKNVVENTFSFHKNHWIGISQQAKDFINVTLQSEPQKRPTALQALFHPWILTYSSTARQFARVFFESRIPGTLAESGLEEILKAVEKKRPIPLSAVMKKGMKASGSFLSGVSIRRETPVKATENKFDHKELKNIVTQVEKQMPLTVLDNLPNLNAALESFKGVLKEGVVAPKVGRDRSSSESSPQRDVSKKLPAEILKNKLKQNTLSRNNSSESIRRIKPKPVIPALIFLRHSGSAQSVASSVSWGSNVDSVPEEDITLEYT